MEFLMTIISNFISNWKILSKLDREEKIRKKNVSLLRRKRLERKRKERQAYRIRRAQIKKIAKECVAIHGSHKFSVNEHYNFSCEYCDLEVSPESWYSGNSKDPASPGSKIVVRILS